MTAVLTGQPPQPSLLAQQCLASQGTLHPGPIPSPGAPHCSVNEVHLNQALWRVSTHM